MLVDPTSRIDLFRNHKRRSETAETPQETGRGTPQALRRTGRSAWRLWKAEGTGVLAGAGMLASQGRLSPLAAEDSYRCLDAAAGRHETGT
ncbi:MAG: hypothetical protein IH628_10315 [Proteobacteria bacterium]|nr:hypothetical protein [Pseudomonadota bacterium]